jgi:alginate O-acetyltransferase complex protein AlgJ
MKKFSLKLLLFLLPALILMLIDLLSPLNAFTFREWEALEFTYPYFSHSQFYPDQKISMTEYGDRGRHTQFEIAKYTTWKTDAFGYRNSTFIKDPDVLLIGDSYFVGSSLSEENTMNTQLQDSLDLVSRRHYKIYNISPNPFERFDFFLKSNLLQNPRVIVLGAVERTINSLEPLGPDRQLTAKEKLVNKMIDIIPTSLTVTVDRMVKFNLIRYISVKLNPNDWINKIDELKKGRTTADKNSSKKMLFFYSAGEVKEKSDSVTKRSIAALLSYKQYCERRGITFIFVPLPDKETIYYDLLSDGLQQRNYLTNLDSALRTNKIHTMNTFDMFIRSKKENPGRILYQYDDTHWGPEGVKIVAGQLAKNIYTFLDPADTTR